VLRLPANPAPNRSAGVPFSPAEQALLAGVDRALVDGRAIRDWWQARDAAGSYACEFELARTFNRPDRAIGFFDTVPLPNGVLPVMGIVQEMAYDRPKYPSGGRARDQVREFVLHYFMRISDFREPEPYVPTEPTGRPADLFLSWCPREDIQRAGFGFSQHYYKLRGSEEVGRFPRGQLFAIVDLREVGPTYDWLVVKVRIFDFNLTFRPFGPDAFTLQIPIPAENFLVVAPEFVTNRDDPAPGILGEYGFGYTFLNAPADAGLLAYGPGHFGAGFQLITFRVREDGTSEVRLVFVVNRPRQITNLRFAPLDWGWRVADLFSLGTASRVLAPVRGVLERFSPRLDGFDPLSASIALANVLTAGWAARELCISRERLERDFLLHHFMQHYHMIVGSLLTWRQIPDWLDAAALPDFALTGVSS
jgi:hypothetical protein